MFGKTKMLLAAVLFVAAGAVNAAPVNINTADAETLARELNGIGAAKAEAIVAYRQANGAFKTVDDIVTVEGIGAATLEKNRDKMTVAD